MAKSASARKPRTATRRASCGVSRYGSETRGSPGRKRRLGVPRSAKETHLPDAVAELERREQPPDQRIHRQRQDEVQEQCTRHAVRDQSGGGRVVEHELQEELPEEGERPDDGDGEGRGGGEGAGGGLAVAARPEAPRREQ